MSVVTGIAQAIGAAAPNGVTGLTWSLTGGNVFEEQSPKSPDTIVSVYSSPGTEADSGLPYDPIHIQIIVRARDPKAATDLWGAIYAFLHGKTYTTLPDGTFLVYMIGMQSSPIQLGPDDSGRYEFSMNLRGEILNPTTHRPT